MNVEGFSDGIDSLNLIKEIELITKNVLNLLNPDRGYEIIKRRYGLEDSQIYTHEQISAYFGVSKSVTSLLEINLIKRLSNVFLGKETIPSLSIPHIVIQEATELRNIFIAKDKIVTLNEAALLVEERYHFHSYPRDLRILKLIMSLLNFISLKRKKVVVTPLFESWFTDNNYDVLKSIQDTQIVIYSLMFRRVRPFSIFDIKLMAKEQLKKDIPTEHIRLALKTFKAIEFTESRLYQRKFEYLISSADKAYRVMSEQLQKQAMPVRDIQKEINHRLALVSSTKKCNLRNLINQMTIDDRFEAVGKGGSWVLSEWEGMTTAVITDIMRDYFYLTKQKANVEMIYEYVRSKRPDASKKSVYTYLKLNNKFVRVSPNEFELSEWGSKPFANKQQSKKPQLKNVTKRYLIQSHIEAYLLTQPDRRALVKDVWIYVQHHVEKCVDRTFYRYLSEMEHVRKERKNNNLYCYLVGRDILLFISYAHKDSRFVDILESNLKQTDFPYFRDVHDLKSGPIESQLRKEIRQRIVLLVLSINSTASDWVQLELEYAREAEKEQGRYVLCPVSIDDSWKTSQTLSDRLRSQISKYFVIDFSSWEDAAAFNVAFEKLINGLHTWYRYQTIKMP